VQLFSRRRRMTLRLETAYIWSHMMIQVQIDCFSIQMCIYTICLTSECKPNPSLLPCVATLMKYRFAYILCTEELRDLLDKGC
jgi:hypothetical protein